MRNNFQPRLYEKYDKDDKRHTKREHAKGTAEYLARKQCGNNDGETAAKEPKRVRTTNRYTPRYNNAPPIMEELLNQL